MMHYEKMRAILDALGCTCKDVPVRLGDPAWSAFDHATQHAQQILRRRAPASPVPICADCTHYEGVFSMINGQRLHLCRNPVFRVLDLVTGISKQVHCSPEREPSGRCGVAGRFFTARTTEGVDGS